MKELLSIAIPTHNRADYLSALITSINDQWNEELNKHIDYIVVGYDVDFNYEKICTSLDALMSGANL